jgi:hypothetical protein
MSFLVAASMPSRPSDEFTSSPIAFAALSAVSYSWSDNSITVAVTPL